jgi:nucleoid-associated protein YgaU
VDLFKLEKLTIEAYRERTRRQPSLGSFQAMFNPNTFNQTYASHYASNKGAGDGTQTATFLSSLPTSLNLNLLLDGTNVGEMGIAAISRALETVKQRIDRFLELAYHVQGDSHEPNYLIVRWGNFLSFSCRLSQVNISYTSFDRDGMPLRAELELELLADEDLKRQLTARPRSSPDVSHSRIVMGGDTLPLMTRRIYGSSAHYLKIARANKLDHFRTVMPGQEILFPPLAK